MYKLDKDKRIILEFKPGVIEEEWRPLEWVILNGIKYSIKGDYEISSWGNVKLTGRLIRKYLTEWGYYRINVRIIINDTETRQITCPIHRLVGFAFISNPENKPHINHKTGIKTRNNYWELEWCTPSENMRHAIDTRLFIHPSGENHGMSVLNEDIVHAICRSLEIGMCCKDISKEYGCTSAVVRAIRNGSNWKHISNKYNIKYISGNLNGENSVNAKLSDSQVINICEFLEKGYTSKDIALVLNVDISAVKRIRRGNSWKHIVSNYIIPRRFK